MKPVWINMDKHDALNYLEGTYTPRTSSVLDPETVIEEEPERPRNEAPELPPMPDLNMVILYDQDGRDWKAMQKLMRITGWVGLEKSGSQIGFGITSRRRSWYIECVDYHMVDRRSMGKGVTLEKAILDFVALNPDTLQKRWNAT